MRPVHDEHCSVACTAEIIGAKWTAVILHDLSEGPRRFSELEPEQLPEVQVVATMVGGRWVHNPPPWD